MKRTHILLILGLFSGLGLCLRVQAETPTDSAPLYQMQAAKTKVHWASAKISARGRLPDETNSLGMRLAYVAPGTFTMGSPKSEADRESQETAHAVELTKGFYVGKHEVTVGEFRKFVRATSYQTDAEKDGKGGYGVKESGGLDLGDKYNWKAPGFEQSDDHPVVLVSWNDAQAFCRWLSEKENKSYRLPTEAEWEYACRAGTETAFAYGNDPQGLAAFGNAGEGPSATPKDGYRHTAAVGQFKANALGLHDMHGNVWEWCEDWYVPDNYTGDRQKDPTGPASGKARVHRGGGWSSSPIRCRSAARIGRHPSAYRGSYLGFRIVLEQSNNPRIERAADAKLGKVFDYLVYDLGKSIELKLVKVRAKGQTFTIGSSAAEQDAVIQKYFHGKRPSTLDFEVEQRITLTDDFYIGRFEVSRGQFRRFVEATGYVTETETTDGGYGWNEDEKKFEGRDKKYSWKHYGLDSYTDASPVINITRKDAREFCKWLEDMGTGNGFALELRLPAETEWEFACRAGRAGRFCFGDGDETLAVYANLADGTRKAMFPKGKGIEAKDGHVFAAPVGQFKPNAFGLYDMHGNVWEWCEDFYGTYTALPKVRNGLQTVSQGERRPVMRGGAWYTGPEACRSAKRRLVGIGGRYGSGGFRVLCIIKEAGE